MGTPAVLEDLAWPEKALQAIEAEARTGRTFDGYQLQQRHGLADPDSPQSWGPIFNTACRRRIIQCVGFHATQRPTRRGGICRVWAGRTQSNGPDATNVETV